MTARFSFPAPAHDPEEDRLRAEVRAFLDAARASGGYAPAADCWVSAASPEFSAKLGARGWLGMTWPKAYGGQDRPPLHRHVVTEELLAAGAPCAAHWVADRQSGGHLLRYGTEAQKRDILPRIDTTRHCVVAFRKDFRDGLAHASLAADDPDLRH